MFLPYSGNGHELQEIQRQNKITAQILENFLELRLFPNKRPTHKLPTVDEILTKTTVRPTRAPTPKPLDRPSAAEQFYDENVDDIDDRETNEQDPESLQSVESEHVDSYYSDDDYGAAYRNQGRWSLGG